MTLNLTTPPQIHTDFSPRITVVGVGGGGTNAVDNMIAMNLQGVEFVVANTDAQQLTRSRADRRIQLGPHLTQGLGAGAKPTVGRAAAEEAADELDRQLDGAHMVFITAGMGGGTGTGAAPVIARMARERNILTVGVVTKPFTFEGGKRARAAEEGIAELQQFVDTLIVIPNQNLFRLANERTGFKEAFKMADNVLYMGVRGVTDLMMAPGLINLDFADIRAVMAEMGKAMMGTGEADGENRAIRAAELAISNPLLEDTSMAGARGLLINITGSEDMTLFELDQAANRIREEVDPDANIIVGAATDEALEGRIRVSVVATGIDTAVPMADERPRLIAVNGGVAPAIASQGVPPAEGTASAPVALSVVPTAPAPNAASPATALRTAPRPQPPQPAPLPLRPAMAPPSAMPQAAPQTLPQMMPAAQPHPAAVSPSPAPTPAHAPTHPPAHAYAAPVPPHGESAAGSIPVIDDTPLPPRQIPAHLARPLTPRPTGGGLFADPPAHGSAPLPRRASSLFLKVTSAFRGAAAASEPAPAAPQPVHAAVPQAAAPQAAAPQAAAQTGPTYAQEQPMVEPQAPSHGERDLEIPTFLRRQSSQPKG